MPDMNDSELITILNSMESDAVINQGIFIAENEELLRRYKGEPYGTEVPGRSSVVSNDVQDTVESDMPSLARVFLGSGEIFKFTPNSGTDRDIEEAENKTKYVDWLIRKQPNSFRVLHGFLKDVSLQKMGVLKYFFEDTETTEEHSFDNMTLEQVEEAIEDFELADGEVDIDVIEKGEVNDDGEFDIKLRVKVKRQVLTIIGVPTESFLLTTGSSDLEDADMVGDDVSKTRGKLLAEGYDRDLVNKLPTISNQQKGAANNSTNMHQIRFDDEGGYTEEQFRIWANETVQISDLYVQIDYDGDGIAERRHIQKSGDIILINEAFNHVPYAMASGILMPHKAIGRSRAEVVAPIAKGKTALQRQLMDNGYMVGNPKMGVNKNVNLDDWLSDTIGGVVRTKGEGNPGNDMLPLEIPFIGDKILLLLQHMDQNKAQSVGSQMASQGLNADQLEKESVARFNGVEDASTAKIELTSRVIAEVGFRKLYEGVAWIVSRFQKNEREFTSLKKPIKANPKNWKFDHHVQSEIGLGSGDNDKIVENMTGIWQIQQGLKLQRSPLVDADKEYNTLTRLSKGLEIKDISDYFNDPAQPDDLLMANNEKLTADLEQATQMIEQLQNPLAEAERIKQEGLLVKTRADAAIAIEKLAEDQRQYNITTAQKHQENIDNMAMKLTELEAKTGQDLSAQNQDNAIAMQEFNKRLKEVTTEDLIRMIE